MFFNTLLTVLVLVSTPSEKEAGENQNVKYFKNLEPITYQDHAISQNKYKYSKIPTKIIKINKISN